jgi:hypothetical protein
LLKKVVRYRSAVARRPDPPPLETNDVVLVAVGTAGWALALVVLLLLDAVGKDIHGWWLWMCAAGIGLGLVGVRFCQRRHAAIARNRVGGGSTQP